MEHGFFILRDSKELRSDEELYEGIKTYIYKDPDKGWLINELINMQDLIWDDKTLGQNKKQEKINEYYDVLRIRGRYIGEQKWKKCDLDIVKKLFAENWQPQLNEKINPDFSLYISHLKHRLFESTKNSLKLDVSKDANKDINDFAIKDDLRSSLSTYSHISDNELDIIPFFEPSLEDLED